MGFAAYTRRDIEVTSVHRICGILRGFKDPKSKFIDTEFRMPMTGAFDVFDACIVCIEYKDDKTMVTYKDYDNLSILVMEATKLECKAGLVWKTPLQIAEHFISDLDSMVSIESDARFDHRVKVWGRAIWENFFRGT